MTKKDYVKIAAVIKDALTVTNVEPAGPWAVRYVAKSLADMLAADNPPSAKTSGFDRERFYKACGIPS